MAKADLTAQRLRELLHYNPVTGVFTRRVSLRGDAYDFGKVAGSVTTAGYFSFNVDGRRYQAHRLAWLYVHGVWPAEQIDHRDTNRQNNAIDNLRESSHKGNHQNLRAAHEDSKTGLLGVSFDKDRRRWKAQIYADGKKHFLGRFDTAQQAHDAYLKSKRQLHPFCTI